METSSVRLSNMFYFKICRIPKKPGGNSAGEKRSPTPNSFQEEGPHMEFNKGKWAKSKKKQQGGQQDNKRVKLNNEWVEKSTAGFCAASLK